VYDEKDPTSLPPATRERLNTLLKQRKEHPSLRIGVPKEYNMSELCPIVRGAWLRTLEGFHKNGHSVHEVSLPTTKQALSAYYVLAPAEASSNLAKYDGVRYGPRSGQCDASTSQLYSRSRQTGFGEEVRRRILLGTYSLSAEAKDNYFIQAQKIRRLVQQEFDNIFAMHNVLSSHEIPDDISFKVDALVCPTTPTGPPTHDDLKSQSSLEAYTGDVFTVPASLAGLPAISVPISSSTQWPLPHSIRGPGFVGMQVITQYGDDERALWIAALMGELCQPAGA